MKRNNGLYNKYYNAYNFGVGKRSFSKYNKPDTFSGDMKPNPLSRSIQSDWAVRLRQSGSSSRDSRPSSQYSPHLPYSLAVDRRSRG